MQAIRRINRGYGQTEFGPFDPNYPPFDPTWQLVSVTPHPKEPGGEQLYDVNLHHTVTNENRVELLSGDQVDRMRNIRASRSAALTDLAKKVTLPPPEGLQNAASWGTILLTGVAVVGLILSLRKKRRRR